MRRFVAVALGAGALAALAVPVTAETVETAPASYSASASAKALDLNLFGTNLTLGLTEGSLTSAPAVHARGVGALLPGLGNVTEQVADSTDGTSAGNATGECGPITLPAAVPLLDLATACAAAQSNASKAASSGLASAGVASVGVGVVELLETTGLTDIVTTTVDQLLGALTPIFDTLEPLGLDASSLVSDLVEGITQGGNIVNITLGPSLSGTSYASGTVTAAAYAAGVVIDVLPRNLLDALGIPLEPVIKIEVGASRAQVTGSLGDGSEVAEYDPALVRVTIAPDIALLLPSALPNPIEVNIGQEICLPLPDPLASCIRVGSAKVTDTADGGKRVETAAVSLDLLTGLPGGGVHLGLAETVAQATANAAVTQDVSTPNRARAAVPELPRTGGDAQGAVIAAALLAVALGGWAISRKGRTTV